MAEIFAQNSRALADTIHRHEKLAEDVSQVKGKVADVESRLELLESGPSTVTEDGAKIFLFKKTGRLFARIVERILSLQYRLSMKR